MQTTKRQITLEWKMPEYVTGLVLTSATVPAYVAGPLAAHRDLNNPDVWQISHLPTGGRVHGRIPTLRAAKSLMSELSALPVDWQNMGATPDRASARLVTDTIRRFA